MVRLAVEELESKLRQTPEQLAREREAIEASREAAQQAELEAKQAQEALGIERRNLTIEQQAEKARQEREREALDKERKDFERKKRLAELERQRAVDEDYREQQAEKARQEREREALDKERKDFERKKRLAELERQRAVDEDYREQQAEKARQEREREALDKERKDFERKSRLAELERQRAVEDDREKMEEQIRQVLIEREEERRKYEAGIMQERERLSVEEKRLREQLAKIELERQEIEERAAKNPDEEELNVRMQKLRECPVYQAAEAALQSLNLDERLFSRLHDRCYCSRCYDKAWPNTIKNDGPKHYVVPRGWVRFGLATPPQAEILDVWKKWCVSFHGAKHLVAKSSIETGDFLMPGDRLPDGSKLESANCAGRTDKVNYTSPTINYAGLAFYARPARGPRHGNLFQVVLQCRQKPDTFRVQAETMGFRSRWKTREFDLCPHVHTHEVEWVTEVRKSLIPYGILIRTFTEANLPEKHFRSPVDPRPLFR
eukprot:TRINITY_DN2763_c0_g1_i3.p1 TRINITY_DN2763_c0_g1~~TRINITY_DN2763_c0_g1_i3.p1  ORF type:complete len:494 (-),score=125.71 TRINITY_DN2763_c0_g1_i3:194-1675(-)